MEWNGMELSLLELCEIMQLEENGKGVVACGYAGIYQPLWMIGMFEY
jgi:hypothetical protein